MSDFLRHGFDVSNLDDFDPKYRCFNCKYLIKNPVQLLCGHRICEICSHPIEPEINYIECLECKDCTPVSEIRRDKGFNKEMQILQVFCILCQWSGQLKQYEEHLEKSHRQYICSYCSETFDSMTLLDEHKKKSCTKILLNCLLEKYGCKGQMFRRELEKHYKTKEHQKSVLLCFSQLLSQFNEQFQISKVADTQMEIEGSDVVSKDTTASSSAATTITTTAETVNDDVQNFLSLINIFWSSIQSLNNDLLLLNDESCQQSQSLEMSKNKVSMMQSSIQESNDLLNAMETNLVILEENIRSLKEMCDSYQVASYDGTLLWKIDRFQERMNDAKSERQVSVYSPPFYSSASGYKMRARLYLYGDGNARRTHMSLFFVLMRSPHDSLLQYPFSFKVTFCLYDQTSQQRHIIDSFRPDVKSNSFQRPRSEMNIASGIPKFIPLAMFEKPDNPYVKDNTMFIKIVVDFENMQKNILPYALSLNPGLPMHTQQMMIKREIERRAQQSQAATKTTTVRTDAEKK